MKKALAVACFAAVLGVFGAGAVSGTDSGAGLIKAYAEDEALVYGDFEYSLDENGNVTIVKFNGTTTDVVIPASIDEKPVTAVADGAFYGCTGIKTVKFESDKTAPEKGSAGFVADGVKAEGVKILCGYSSLAKKYAEENGFECEITDLVDISNAIITLSPAEFTYDGSSKKPGILVLYGGNTLSEGVDYKLIFSNNNSAGNAAVRIVGTGRFTGSVEKSFTIKKASLTGAEVTLSASSFVYNANAVTPTVTVRAGGRMLVKNRDYTLTYKNNDAVGTAYVTITGIGNYEGSLQRSFSIKLADVTGLKAKAATESSVTLTWKKTTGASGYKVYMLNSTTGKYVLKTTVSSNTATISGLTAGTKYKFGVKACRTQGGKTYTSKKGCYTKVTAAPAKVDFSIATTQKGKAKLSWKKTKGATSYVVYYKQKKADKWKKITTLSSSARSYTVTGLSGKKGGYLTVKAFVKNGSVNCGGKFKAKKIYKYQKAAARLDVCGWDIKKACYAAAVPWIGAGLPRSGSVTMEWYADYGFSHGYGHCFCMAAMFAEMAKTMGYDCRQVHGAVGTSVHSWTELTLNGTTYICDPDFITETGRNGFCIVYGTHGTWMYSKYGYVATKG